LAPTCSDCDRCRAVFFWSIARRFSWARIHSASSSSCSRRSFFSARASCSSLRLSSSARFLCFLIGFAVTSWEALITPAPPNTFADGSEGFAGQLTDIIWKRWLIVSYYIDKYTPPDYQNAVRVGVSIYLFLACFLLLFPTYRKLPKDFIRDSMWEYREVFPFYLFVGVLVGLSGWAFSAAQGSGLGGGTKFLLGVLSIPAVVALIVIVLTSILWVPAVLFLLPAWLFWAVSQPFKVAYFLVAWRSIISII
jgi:hypothetical protein